MDSMTVPPKTPLYLINQIVSIQQPIGIGQVSISFREKAEQAARDDEERQQQEKMAARMDEESGRTAGGGRQPTPVGGIIFGSRLAGPAARPAPAPETIRIVEGIKVPPRPDEPDNCCMSYSPPATPTCPPFSSPIFLGVLLTG